MRPLPAPEWRSLSVFKGRSHGRRFEEEKRTRGRGPNPKKCKMKPPSPREKGLHPKQHLKGQQDEGYHCVCCRRRPHLALTSLPLASCVLLLLLPLLPLTWGYPSYLLNPDGCRSQKLEVGFDIMGSPVVEEKAMKESPIVVLRGDTALHSGSEYKSGETLSVKLEGRAGMYCMEVRGGAAMFSGGACDGTRVTEPDVLALPIGDKETLQTVTLHVGLASRYGPVTLLPPFVLHPPGKDSAAGKGERDGAFLDR
ncbi:hypothetical protein Naga_100514g1 [Nannochloropsis gaditana]|uniref:Uncharacterized protein n=1 Tax=Nannochloropsis gaditana TaxID=72520 RepID=W7T185_9STRA|nr:hypothetical protein Naga_100514g1 [Nannochloropsis gaditana]